MTNKSEEIYAVQILDKAKVGLHARPVAKIVAITNDKKYKETTVEVVKLNDNTNLNEKITLNGSEPKANGKSILSFIGLAVKHENKIAFVIHGPNGKEIINSIKKVLKDEHLIA
ncbi:MAG: HPr family phosphocarrier protein [Spiroplasma sp.]|nr:HPr family phosphocarrier protein [Spiroplasma sp.]